MMDTLSVLMGVDLAAANDDDMGRGDSNANKMEDDSMGEPVKKEEPKEEPKQEEMVDDEPAENVKMAENEKKLGTAAYKAKNFEEAHKHYSKAAELDPKNMVYYMNTAAVYLEQKEFQKC